MIDFEGDFGDLLEAVPEEYYDRSRFVPGAGRVDAAIMLVGEAPGAREVEQGEPFVGPAGQQLNRTLRSLGIDREDLYLTNIVKVRPPENRTPRKGEIAAWRPLLRAEIERVDPQVIVVLGTTASQVLLDTDEGITAIHGRRFDYDGRVIIPAFHPAATLYNRELLPEFEGDLREAFQVA